MLLGAQRQGWINWRSSPEFYIGIIVPKKYRPGWTKAYSNTWADPDWSIKATFYLFNDFYAWEMCNGQNSKESLPS